MSSPILGGAIKRPLQDVVVAESQLAELECEVANPSAEGLWLKDGQHVFFSDNIRSQDVGELRRLVIIITRPQDVGEYTYQLGNSKTTAHLKVEGTHQLMLYIYSLAVYIFGGCVPSQGLCAFMCSTETQQSLFLTFSEVPLMIVSPLSDVQVYEEEDAMFECEVSREAKSFRWLKEAEELTASEKYEMLHEGTKHMLVVKSITKDDLVKYVFEGADGIHLRFVTPIKEVTVKERETAEFKVELSHANIQVTWYRNDVRVRPSKKIQISEDGKIHTLTLKEVCMDDTSLIKVEALGVTSEGMLNVIVEKDEVVLVCELSKPAAEVKWFKDSKELAPSKNIVIRSEGKKRILTIKRAEKSNIGEYTCDCISEKTMAKLNIEGESCWLHGQNIPHVLQSPVSYVELTECEVSRENAKVTWLRDGQEIRKTKKHEIVVEGRKRRLIILECTLEDSKTYTCDSKDFKTSAFLNVEPNYNDTFSVQRKKHHL
uniref:non-specific serine/threonine protein kinase n=1 Tax=Paramormyrops kingsleyae TaxID=1676925 RepID=A0A3B3QG32_9TELE